MSLPTKVTNLAQLYEQDFALWVDETAELLRSGNLDRLDIPNLIEEIASMGRSEKNALASNTIVILMHLLKYQCQPQKRTNSWRYTIKEHRFRVSEAFETSPSLKKYFQDNFSKCYQKARDLAATETGLSLESFPKESPYTLEETLNSEYLPK